MAVDAPSGLPIKWFPISQSGANVWGILKAKLTGKKTDFGHYSSEVNLSESDADRLIENIKKDPNGYPYLDDHSGQYDEKYQKWLVDEYLEKPFPKQTDKKIEDVEVNKLFAKSTATATKEKPKGALVAVGKRGEDLVDEEIDERILRILGLEDTFDIDYATYKSLLKEQSVLISTGKSNLPREEEMIIQEEFKRIKGEVGRFKIKKKKISADSFFGKNVKDNNAIVKYQQPNLAITTSKIKPTAENIVGENVEILERIEKLIREIQNQLTDEEKLNKGLSEKERRKRERYEKTKKEDKLESFKSNISSTFKKIIAPVQGIFDRIFNAFKLLLFGWAIDKLFKFIRNPENEKTVTAVFDFLSRNIGKLVLLYFLLNSPFVKITRWLGKNLIKFLVRMAADLLRGKGILNGIRGGKLLKGLKGAQGLLGGARAVATNPVVLGTAAIAGTAILSNEVTGQREAAPIQADQKAKADRGKGTSLQGVGGVGDMGAPSPTGSLQGLDTGADKRQNFKDGGSVKGPGGVDNVKANLTRGEFVVAAPAVKKIGLENLMAMNAMGGGDNNPKIKNGEMYAAGGGYSGGIEYFSSNDGQVNKPLLPKKQYSFADTKLHHGNQADSAKRANGFPRDYTLLDGTNLQSSPNSKIPIPVDGQVLEKNPTPGGGYGNHVIVKTSLGNMLFGHLSKFGSIKVGDNVSAGTIMGVQGNTPGGMADHLHIDASPAGHEAFINYITSGKAVHGSTSGSSSDDSQTTDTNEPKPSDLTLSPEDSKMANAYLQYITQPMARGLDILPTIDKISTPSVSSASGPSNDQQTRVPSGSATNPNNPQALAAASRRQLTGATR